MNNIEQVYQYMKITTNTRLECMNVGNYSYWELQTQYPIQTQKHLCVYIYILNILIYMLRIVIAYNICVYTFRLAGVGPKNHALLKSVLCGCNRSMTETCFDQKRWALGLAPGQLLVLHERFAQPKDTWSQNMNKVEPPQRINIKRKHQ